MVREPILNPLGAMRMRTHSTASGYPWLPLSHRFSGSCSCLYPSVRHSRRSTVCQATRASRSLRQVQLCGLPRLRSFSLSTLDTDDCADMLNSAGGHTSEALSLLSALDFGRYVPRTYIISEGDALSMQKVVDLESEKAAEVPHASSPVRFIHTSCSSSCFFLNLRSTDCEIRVCDQTLLSRSS